jgi:glutamyl-tRNA synthetase
VLLYQAFGWEPPRFAHLPSILGPDRKKLSKRHGPTGIDAFQSAGYLPEALINYLALCGWSPGTDEEIFSLPELVERFEIERVSPTGAIFDHAKLDWFNGLYIRKLAPADLARRMRPFLGAKAEGVSDEELTAIAALLQDRLRTLGEGPELADFFLTDRLDYDPALLVQRGTTHAQTVEALNRAADLATSIEPFAADAMEAPYRELAETLGLKVGQFFMSIRVAVTGRTATPPLFQTMEVLGRERSVRRLRDAVFRIDGPSLPSQGERPAQR